LFNDLKQDFPTTYRYTRNLLFGRSFKQAQIKTTVSAYSSERISYHYNIPPAQITIIPNSANTFTAGTSSSKSVASKYISDKYGIENFILCVSRIEPRKNQALLLEAYLQLKLQKKNISLVFIGKESIDTPCFKNRLHAEQTQNENKIYWFEQVPPDDLQAFYSSCRLFVYPSKGEGFGIPPLEAAISKAPVLCSSTSAMKDFSFFNPYTFHPSNENELKDKLQWIINNPPCNEFLNNVAKQINEQYSWKKSAEILYRLIKQNTIR